MPWSTAAIDATGQSSGSSGEKAQTALLPSPRGELSFGGELFW